jgi:hypothetical protein
MTWKTSSGERVLQGAEANLFASAIAMMIDMMRDNMSYGGDRVLQPFSLIRGPFQHLSTNQQLSVLYQVASALLTKTKVPELTAINESAVYYVYKFVQHWVDQDYLTTWGPYVKAAYNQVKSDDEDRLRLNW